MVSRSLVLESGSGEDAYEGLLEVCRQFLDEGVPDDRFDDYGAEQGEGEGKGEDEERLGGERCAGSAVAWGGVRRLGGRWRARPGRRRRGRTRCGGFRQG